MLRLLYACFESAWRRCFGSSGWDLPIISNRFVQHVIGFIITALFLWSQDYNIYQIIIAAGLLQGIFWARSHGCCFDYGHGEVDVKRYEQLWYWKYLKKFIPDDMLYGYQCDYFLMYVRYTLPSLLLGLILLSIPTMTMGLLLSGTYAFCWTLYDLKLVKNPTEIAEWVSGFIIGLVFGL